MRQYVASVKSGSSSVGSELLWLALFLAMFAIIALAMNYLLVVPTGFNDRISVSLAGFFAAVIWIMLRGRFAKRR